MAAHPYPWAVEREYQAFARARAAAVNATLADGVKRTLKGVAADATFTDARATRAIAAVKRAAKGVRGVPPDEAVLGEFALRIGTWARRTLNRELPKSVRVPRLLLEEGAWVERNVKLLKKLDESIIAGFETALIEAVGAQVGDLNAMLVITTSVRLDTARPNGRIVMTGPTPIVRRTPLQVATARANTIGQDQTGKGAGRYNEQAQKAAGVGGYEWITQGDSLVRPEHARRAGKRFMWNRPPPDGHPGEPINCRCYARPRVAVKRSTKGVSGRIRL